MPNATQNPNKTPIRSTRVRLLALAQLLVVASIVWFVAQDHPSDQRLIPECPSRSLLGVQCPGCGSTRAIHKLANADPAAAFRYNPLMVILGLPAAAVYGWVLVVGVARGRWPALPNLPGSVIWAILAVLVVYTIARNIPAWDWLRPPPHPTPNE